MKKIEVINAVAKCEEIKKGDKIIAIEYLSNPKTKFLSKDEWIDWEYASVTIGNMFTWIETPQGELFWSVIQNKLADMENPIIE
jgi:hypothetical protein